MVKNKKGGKGKKPAAKADPPDFVLDLDTVFVRTSRTQLKVQPKAEYLNEPPMMNMAMDQEGDRQVFTIHYKKPHVPPPTSDAAIQTDRPTILRILPAQIVARYTCLTEKEVPSLERVPKESKYVLNTQAQILTQDNDSESELGLSDLAVLL